jgi:glycosyltransferase involved in cell wall biosynthesis
MQYRYYPKIYPKGQYTFFRLFIPLSARTSTAIVTDANSTKLDLERFLAIPPQKVSVIHLAPDPRFAQLPASAHVEAVRIKHHLSDRYILTVSSFRPQKNTLRLVEAYSRLRKKGICHKLVLVGRKLAPYSDVEKLIRRLGLANEVITTGYLKDEDLPALYAGADLFAFPSFFEGFGIPVLEAMSCGVPVVLSNAASLPEAGGRAGYYIDPDRVDELTEAMYHVLTESDLRQTLSAKGRAHAKRFSWDRVARETLHVYRQAAERYG